MTCDVIIIGAGPAGLTASIYTSRAGLKTLVLESVSKASQVSVTDRIENYPGFPEGISGIELAEKFRAQAKGLGVEFASGDVSNITRAKDKTENSWQVVVDNDTHKALSVIIASGARPMELGVEGEKRLQGKGVSYCAVCDGPFFKDKNVVVVGGGDTAIDEALFLANLARKVTIIHRRGMLRATKILQDRVLSNNKIDIRWDSVLEEIKGDQRVEGVCIKDLKKGDRTDLNTDGVFIFVGYAPNTSFAENVVKLTEKGHVIVDKRMWTSQKGIFACGDCRDTDFRQVVTACGDGAHAADSACEYVEKTKGIEYK